MPLDPKKTLAFVQETWDRDILPTLTEYVKIPAKSPMFDADWQAHGHIDRAVALIEAWCRARKIDGLRVEVVRLAGRTPVIFMEVPGRGDDTVLLYGHLDKQPEMVGWGEGLGPWTPVRRGDKLYGRGLRRERLPRPALLRGRARPAHRHAEPGDLPRLRLL